MSITTALNRESAISRERLGTEHLHLHLRRTHWETKFHTNLGTTLQEALDQLDREGWEVVSSWAVPGGTPEFVIRRTRIWTD